MAGSELDLTSMVNLWLAQEADYDYETNTCSSECSHYTQIIWADTTKVTTSCADILTLPTKHTGGLRWYKTDLNHPGLSLCFVGISYYAPPTVVHTALVVNTGICFQLGCAYSQCSDGYMLVCSYSPPGSHETQRWIKVV